MKWASPPQLCWSRWFRKMQIQPPQLNLHEGKLEIDIFWYILKNLWSSIYFTFIRKIYISDSDPEPALTNCRDPTLLARPVQCLYKNVVFVLLENLKSFTRGELALLIIFLALFHMHIVFIEDRRPLGICTHPPLPPWPSSAWTLWSSPGPCPTFHKKFNSLR